MTTTLLVMFDGRKDYLNRTMSTLNKIRGIDNIFINDDSGDVPMSTWLVQTYGAVGVTIKSSPSRSGFGGAIRNAWSELRKTDADYIFHLEQDFELTKTIDVPMMIRVLEDNENLVQLALRRQPWNDTEKKFGGIVESNPYAYHQRSDFLGNKWLEQSLFFTTNPTLYRASLMDMEWPNESESEGKFGIKLFEDPNKVTGYWGSRESGEWCFHIGDDRIGTGY